MVPINYSIAKICLDSGQLKRQITGISLNYRSGISSLNSMSSSSLLLSAGLQPNQRPTCSLVNDVHPNFKVNIFDEYLQGSTS